MVQGQGDCARVVGSRETEKGTEAVMCRLDLEKGAALDAVLGIRADCRDRYGNTYAYLEDRRCLPGGAKAEPSSVRDWVLLLA